jgi:hypothetical protein
MSKFITISKFTQHFSRYFRELDADENMIILLQRRPIAIVRALTPAESKKYYEELYKNQQKKS